MAKVTKGAGPSFTEEELNDPAPPVVIRRAMLGSDPLSVDGTPSEESSEKPRTPSPEQGQNPQSPAHVVVNPSEQEETSQTQVQQDSASSMGGNGQTTEQESPEPYEGWTYAQLQAECKDRGLPASGKTEELLARLIESDEPPPEDADDFA